MQNADNTHFSSLRVTDENAKFCKEEMKAFAHNLHHVYEEMENRFSEFTYLSVSEKLLRNLFDIDTTDFRQKEDKVKAKFQLKSLQLQRDTDLQNKAPKGMPMVIIVHLSCSFGRSFITSIFHI